MPTNHYAVAAVPATGATAALRSGLVGRYAYCLAAGESASDFVAIDPDTGDVCPAIIQGGLVYGLDNLDATTAAGPTCLVSYDSKRYKLDDLTTPFSVLSKALTSPPVSPAIGDWYLIYSTPSGDWAGWVGRLAAYTSRGWESWVPPIGFRVLVEDEGAEGTFYFRDPNGDWQTGLGGIVLGGKTIPMSALMWSGASPVLRVQNQTTWAPPGSRATGATPTAPLGGTAANLNDNNTATLCTTSSLTDLTAAVFASRIVAQLDLGSVQNLIAVEATAVAVSAASAAPGLYYSSDGATWTALGSALAVTTAATRFIRTGNVSARYVALVLDQANYSGKTLSIGDLNAYTDTVTANVGDNYVIGTGGIGIFAGNDLKIALCEAPNTLTVYAPQDGDEVYDISLKARYRWDGSAWRKASGNWKRILHQFTSAGTTTFTKSATCFGVLVQVVAGGGAGSSSAGNGTDGQDSSFGSHVIAKAGFGAHATPGNGGSGGVGDFTIPGDPGQSSSNIGGASYGPIGSAQMPASGFGIGGRFGSGSPVGTGGGGGYAEGWIDAADLSTNEVVTVGAGGVAAGDAFSGHSGAIFLYEYVTI